MTTTDERPATARAGLPRWRTTPGPRRPTTTSWQAELAARFGGSTTTNADRRERWATPADLAAELDGRFIRTPAIDAVNAAIHHAMSTPDSRLIISMPPQEGKSTIGTGWTPVHVLSRRPDTRFVIASYGADVARRMGRGIRDKIAANSARLGIRVRDDVNAQNEFELAGHRGGVYAVGIGGSLTSRPADQLLIDDPLKDREQADSKVYRDRVWDWWTDVASARLAPGASVVLILTRWHEDDLAGRFLAAEDGHRWTVVNIPAQADHRPELGEVDPLGREPGEFMLSARGRTRVQWEQRKTTAGARTWAALYQGRPAPADGGIFRREWWDDPRGEGSRRYAAPLWVLRDDDSRWVPGVAGHGGTGELIQSWDLTFKDTDRTDYVVGQVWLRRGADVFLLDQVRRRMDFPATVAAVRELSARWPQALLKLVEDKANGPAVIASLRHELPGIVPVEPDGSKTARAEAVSPLVEAGNVHLPTPQLAPWVAQLTEEAAGFPNATHDDTVDALTQALNRLVLMPMLAGGLDDDVVTSDDLFDDDDVTQLM